MVFDVPEQFYHTFSFAVVLKNLMYQRRRFRQFQAGLETNHQEEQEEEQQHRNCSVSTFLLLCLFSVHESTRHVMSVCSLIVIPVAEMSVVERRLRFSTWRITCMQADQRPHRVVVQCCRTCILSFVDCLLQSKQEQKQLLIPQSRLSLDLCKQ